MNGKIHVLPSSVPHSFSAAHDLLLFGCGLMEKNWKPRSGLLLGLRESGATLMQCESRHCVSDGSRSKPAQPAVAMHLAPHSPTDVT
jgi:hypothetical protein